MQYQSMSKLLKYLKNHFSVMSMSSNGTVFVYEKSPLSLEVFLCEGDFVKYIQLMNHSNIAL